MSNAESPIQSAIEESNQVKARLGREQAGTIRRISELFIEVLRAGGTIYFCGNGGSAADSQHVAAEFVGRFLRQRRPLSAAALTTNVEICLCVPSTQTPRIQEAHILAWHITRDLVEQSFIDGK